MTREELIKALCPSFMTSNCENQVDCNYCKEIMNKWLVEHDKQIRENLMDEVAEVINKYVSDKFGEPRKPNDEIKTQISTARILQAMIFAQLEQKGE